MKFSSFDARAFTLVELLITVTILGIVAAASLRLVSYSSTIPISLAAEEVANAFVYAANESYRQNKFFGVSMDTSNNLVRVFELDTSSLPATPLYTVYHPLTKKLYNIDLDDDQRFGHASMDVLTLTFSAACSGGNQIYFDQYGEAKCTDPLDVRTTLLQVDLNLGNQSARVEVEPGTGKVTIQ